jgi:hypothetical protein
LVEHNKHNPARKYVTVSTRDLNLTVRYWLEGLVSYGLMLSNNGSIMDRFRSSYEKVQHVVNKRQKVNT